MTRRRMRQVQEAIDSLGGLFNPEQPLDEIFGSGQEDEQSLPLEMQPKTEYEVVRDAILEAITGEGFNETFENSDRDSDINNSLMFFNELLTERHFDEHGFAYPNSFDALPDDMQMSLASDVLFLENMQNLNDRPDAIREALRRAADRSREEGLYDSYDYDTFFNPDLPVTNESMGGHLGAFRQDEIFKEIDKAIARVRILNHHLGTYRRELSGGGGNLVQDVTQQRLSSHLDSLFHPIHGYMMGHDNEEIIYKDK